MLRHAQAKGQVIILGLVFLAVVSLAAVSVVSYEGVYVRQARKNYHQEQTLALAEAGINKAVWKLNQTSGSYSGETLNFGGGTVVVTVANVDSKNKLLEATAYLPDQIHPLSQKKVRLKISDEPPSSAVSFHYGVQVGEGGVTMENGSLINGNLYSNGSLSGDGVGHSTIADDVWVAGGSQPVADQAMETTDSDFTFGRVSPQLDSAQGFTPATSTVLNKVSLYLKKVGSPTNLTIYIVTDNNGQPSKNSIAQAALQSSLVSTDYSWLDVSFSAPPSLIANTLYWILIDTSADINNYWLWGKNSADNYARGTAFYSVNWNVKTPIWTALGADLAFKAWLGGVATFIEGLTIGGDVHVNTINNSSVNGDAYYQALADTIVIGSKFPNSPDPGPQSYPISAANIANWKAAAAAGNTIEGDFNPSDWSITSLGPTKINGNLIIDNGQILKITGTVWVTGHIEIDNLAIIILDPKYEDNSGVILTDGWIHVSNNGLFLGSGHVNSFIMMVSLSPCKGGDQTPACADHNAAIDIHNNVFSTIFYAPEGLIYLHNRVTIKEAVAYKLQLSQNTEVDYESGLAQASFTNGPGGSWQAVKGYWQEVK